MLSDCTSISLCLCGDRVFINSLLLSSLLLQTFFMESDLDCYESVQDHIHVRNAGIIDELGHITFVLFHSLIRRHILSDKTGTITENNLRVVALTTPLHEFSLIDSHSNDSLTQSADPCLSRLLLNMLTNHSALSIKNTSSSDLTEFANSISYAQSQSCVDSLTKSSSFSELCITSLPDDQPCNWIQEPEEEVQVFCSSQDERVWFSSSYQYRPFLMLWLYLDMSFVKGIRHRRG